MMRNLRQRLERPIKDKFKSTLPTYSADSLLLAVMSKIASRPGLAEHAGDRPLQFRLPDS